MYVYKNIDEHNPNKENKILIVFGDMIADMIHNKELNQQLPNCLLEVEIKYFPCFYHTIIFLKFQKMLG